MMFEGEQVDGLRIVVRQYTGDISVPLTVDEVVHMNVVGKVTNVGYEVNRRTGQLHRVHTIRVEEVEI